MTLIFAFMLIYTIYFLVDYKDKYGFFVEKDNVKTNIDLTKAGDAFVGSFGGMDFELSYTEKETHLEINVVLKNNGEDFDGRIKQEQKQLKPKAKRKNKRQFKRKRKR